MSESFVPESQTALLLTTEIVCAYVANNPLPASDLARLVQDVHGALSGLGGAKSAAEPAIEMPSASEIRKSIRPDGLVSFLDGKPYKTLRRHLTTRGLNPDSYRARYGLPSDYPMTAPNYSAKRSELAKSLGLGQRPTAQAAE